MAQILPPPTPDPFAYANVHALRSLVGTISQIKQGRLRKQQQNVIMQATTQEEARGGLAAMQEERQEARPTGLGGFVDRFNPMTASYGPVPGDILNQAFRLPTEADIGDQQLDRRYKEARIGATDALTRSRSQLKAGKVRTPEKIDMDIERTEKALGAAKGPAMQKLYTQRLEELKAEYADTQGMEFYEKPGEKRYGKRTGWDWLAKDVPPSVGLRKKTAQAPQISSPTPKVMDVIMSQPEKFLEGITDLVDPRVIEQLKRIFATGDQNMILQAFESDELRPIIKLLVQELQ